MKVLLITNMIHQVVVISFLLMMMMKMKVGCAERMIRFIFNNGFSPEGSTACTTADETKINAIFGTNAVINRRALSTFSSSWSPFNETTTNIIAAAAAAMAVATNTTSSSKEEQQQQERSLWPLYCRDNCAGYRVRTCRATGCVGYRRGRKLEEMEMNDITNNNIITDYDDDDDDENGRKVQQVDCSQQVASIHQSLDNLITTNAISETCKSYLALNKRSTECYNDVIYGDVLGLTVWNAPMNQPATVLTNYMPATGYTVCNSTFFTVTSHHHPCVERMHYELYGWDGWAFIHSQYAVPYSLFSDEPDGTLYGRRLKVGFYTLHVTPDFQFHKKRTWIFEVKNC